MDSEEEVSWDWVDLVLFGVEVVGMCGGEREEKTNPSKIIDDAKGSPKRAPEPRKHLRHLWP